MNAVTRWELLVRPYVSILRLVVFCLMLTLELACYSMPAFSLTVESRWKWALLVLSIIAALEMRTKYSPGIKNHRFAEGIAGWNALVAESLYVFSLIRTSFGVSAANVHFLNRHYLMAPTVLAVVAWVFSPRERPYGTRSLRGRET